MADKSKELDCIHNHGVGCYSGADCTHCGFNPQEEACRDEMIDEMLRKGESHICIKKGDMTDGNSDL